MVALETDAPQAAGAGLGHRLRFIDFARGLVMVIMAWDHVSGFWMEVHGGLEGVYGYRNPSLDLTLFLARFVSHFCAPTFVFLSGTSLAMSVYRRRRRGEPELGISLHIVKRGLLLLAFESLIVSPAFDLPWLYFGVIAAIGVSLIVFSVARWAPPLAVLGSSLVVVLNHQWLDLGFIPADVAWGHYLRRVLHEPGFNWRPYFALYPVIPWIGVLGLGWVFGVYLNGYDRDRLPALKLPLAVTGLASLAAFFVVRYVNGYGNLVKRWSGGLMDWLYVSKYPPSVAFLLWSLGGMCLFMAAGGWLQEKGWADRGVPGVIHTFGRTPLFFYLTHLWLYRFRLPGAPLPFHLALAQTVAAWLAGLAVLWQLCTRYERLKRRHPRLLQYI
ncbi:DUF1624 domain-containing protein [Candidatus Bathyarchaeota archaeon]|nr:DUF1624 domain-containing protein [Candidatus Bathyarchaeota archaeon]